MNRHTRRRLGHTKHSAQKKIQISSDWQRVDTVYSARFTVRENLIYVDWCPREPTPEDHPPVLNFLKLRHAFLLGVAQKIGRPVVADLGFA